MNVGAILKLSQLEKSIASLKDDRRVIDLAIAKLEAQRPKQTAIKLAKPAKADGPKL